MKLEIGKPEGRDAVVVILARNGYTVRQGKEKRPDRKQPVSFVGVILHGE